MELIKEKIREYIVQNFLFGDTETQFSDDDSFMEQGIIDSTGILELIQFIEREFGIKVNDDEILPANLDSLNNLENYIKRKKSVEQKEQFA